MIEELERIALTSDLPDDGLKAGDVGMVAQTHADHRGYADELVTLGGEGVALVSLYSEQIRRLEADEIASSRRVRSA